MDIQLATAIVEAVGIVTGATITGVFIFLSAKKVASREALQGKLMAALNDLLTYNAFEQELLKRNGEFKNKFRQAMRENGYELSGKHTPSKIKRELDNIR